MSDVFPPDWSDRVAGYAAVRQTIGKSHAGVFRLEAPGRPTLFIKTERQHPHAELMDEAARLRWLATQAIPAPQVLAVIAHDGADWLLMSALPGRDMATQWELGPDHLLALTAEALRRLHALDIADCPFDHRLDRRIVLAKARMDAGLVDESDFHPHRLGRTVQSVFPDVLATRPAAEDLVVTHGDACFPNFMVDGGAFTGFIDCGRLGVADRYQDLALAFRSAESNFAAGAGDQFLRAYGITEPDREKLQFARRVFLS